MELRIYRGYEHPLDVPDDHVVSIIATAHKAAYVLPEALKSKYAHIDAARLQRSWRSMTVAATHP